MYEYEKLRHKSALIAILKLHIVNLGEHMFIIIKHREKHPECDKCSPANYRTKPQQQFAV